MVIHPCIYAEGNYGNDAYKCKRTGCRCKAQFFCNNEKYWRPTYQIKCPDFKRETDEVKPESETQDKEQSNNNK